MVRVFNLQISLESQPSDFQEKQNQKKKEQKFYCRKTCTWYWWSRSIGGVHSTEYYSVESTSPKKDMSGHSQFIT